MTTAIPAGTLRLSSRTLSGAVTVTVAGEVDLATTPQLRACVQEVLKAGAWQLTLELSGVSFIGAGGLGTLVVVQHLAQRQGSTLLLAGVSPQLRRLVEITRLEGHFTFAP
ncbi:MAG: STAS domain-containing protein [Streptosporangiaceae bacterium]